MPQVLEQQVVIHSGNGALSGMLYRPGGKPSGAVLFCDPLFEERKSAQRVLVEAARALAAAGYAVLRFDYRGCGDSSGDFAEFAPCDWHEDVRAAWAFLQEQVSGVPTGLLGLRFGATLAATAASLLPEPRFAVLWEPIQQGHDYLQQELRKKLMKEMVTFGGSRETRETLLQRLESGEIIDFDGYPVSPRLYRELRAVDLTARPLPASCATLFLSIGSGNAPASAVVRSRASLAASGAQVDLRALREQPFWNLIGHVECNGLIGETVAWIKMRNREFLPGPAPARAVPASGQVSTPVSGAATGADHFRIESKAPAAPPAIGHGETLVSFCSQGETVRAVLHRADSATTAGRPAVVFLHGWSGGRLGPHRMFVKLARRLAAAGFTCLRADCRGRGDSDGNTSGASIQSMIADAKCAIAFLEQQLPRQPVILLGICSGGKVAIGAAVGDSRVAGLVLWSGEALGSLRNRATNARKSVFAFKDYLRKLGSAATWRKLFSGRVHLRLVGKALFRHETRAATEAQQEEAILHRFRSYPGGILFIYGGNDPDTRLAAENYRRFCASNRIVCEFHEIREANHSFYALAWEGEVMALTERWLKQDFAGN